MDPRALPCAGVLVYAQLLAVGPTPPGHTARRTETEERADTTAAGSIARRELASTNAMPVAPTCGPCCHGSNDPKCGPIEKEDATETGAATETSEPTHDPVPPPLPPTTRQGCAVDSPGLSIELAMLIVLLGLGRRRRG